MIHLRRIKNGKNKCSSFTNEEKVERVSDFILDNRMIKKRNKITNKNKTSNFVSTKHFCVICIFFMSVLIASGAFLSPSVSLSLSFSLSHSLTHPLSLSLP